MRGPSSLRHVLEWTCPDRYPDATASTSSITGSSKNLDVDARRLLVPFTAFPLLEGPRIAELEESALAIGIPSKAARITANYVGFNGDLDDARSMWNLIKECNEIDSAAMRRLLRTRCVPQGISMEHCRIDDFEGLPQNDFA